MLIILSNSNTCGPTKSNTKYCGKRGQQMRIIPGQVASTVSCMVQHFVLLHRALVRHWGCWVGSGNKAKTPSLPLTCFCHDPDLFSTPFLARLHKTCFTNAHEPQSAPEGFFKTDRRHKGSGDFGGCFGVICHQLEQIYVRERLKPWNTRKGSGGVGDGGWCAV